jgi:aminopeptidase-like protein
MRSKCHTFAEYHTSLDDLAMVTPAGLEGAYAILRDCLELLEHSRTYRTTSAGEPHLDSRGLYPTLGTRSSYPLVRSTLDLLAYADGSNDLIAISDIIGVPVAELYPIAETLAGQGLLGGALASPPGGAIQDRLEGRSGIRPAEVRHDRRAGRGDQRMPAVGSGKQRR